jgi:hypothetical protein
MDRSVVEVLGIYDADGGLRGEVSYVVGKLLGRVHCSLCDVTHSPLGRKKAWDELVRSSTTPLRVVHRNELSAPEAAAVEGVALPVLLGRSIDGGWRVLVDAVRLDELGGSVAGFRAEVAAALQR